MTDQIFQIALLLPCPCKTSECKWKLCSL